MRHPVSHLAHRRFIARCMGSLTDASRRRRQLCLHAALRRKRIPDLNPLKAPLGLQRAGLGLPHCMQAFLDVVDVRRQGHTGARGAAAAVLERSNSCKAQLTRSRSTSDAYNYHPHGQFR